jgi:S-adenosylmethionine-diacylglycerol 3-amino-3-carboxypropyl transferase
MSTLLLRIQKIEFESRIFVSFGLVAAISALSFTVYAGLPANAVALGRAVRMPGDAAAAGGFAAAALFSAAASFLRIWAGSVLTSRRMMSFKVKVDAFVTVGPYRIVRNPIYLADLIAFTGFTLVLPPVGLLLPVLLYGHYTQLIRYEELSLRRQYREAFGRYEKLVPRLLPNAPSLRSLGAALREIVFTRDGIRHNALYLLFIIGFLVAAPSGHILVAVAIGLPAVLDWAVIHTRIGTAGESAPAAKPKKVFADVLYASCWEDPSLDREAFRIGPEDTVFSIASGGCNALTFLLDDPAKVVALDINPHQIGLLDLKMTAFRRLTHGELLELFGVRPSRRRQALYRRIRSGLRPETARYWDARPKAIRLGLIHAGRYERYMRLLRRTVVRICVSRRLVGRMFATEDPAERERLYRRRWQNRRWKLLTRLMLSRALNAQLFDPAFFDYVKGDFSFGRHFAAKAECALVRLPMKESYFLSYILLGRYYSEQHLPPYLRAENFATVRARLHRVTLVTGRCEDFFATLPVSSFSKLNFSNIFEWMSPGAFEGLLRETVRVARDGAVLTYRNLLVPREHPASLEPSIRSRKDVAAALRDRDLSFIYDGYVVEEIVKRSLP